MSATIAAEPEEPSAGPAPASAAGGDDGSGFALLHGTPLLLMTFAISLATFMEVLDMTIVNVSVPAISGSLGVSPNEGTWAISSYSLAAAIMQPLTGWLARRFGEVRLFVTCVALFVVFSAFCGLSSSMGMLVVGRLLQGAVSGPMVPMAQALLLRNYAPDKRGLAIGIWAMIIFVAPIFGPIIGGWITDNFSWPWIFFINVPLGLLSAATIWGLLHKRETRRVRVPIDAVGLGLLIAGVGSLQFVLDNGNDKDWFASTQILVFAVVAVIALMFLVAWEWTDRHPVIDLHLFQHRNFRVGVIAICVGFFGFFGSTVVFPLWLQTTLGYTATWAGLATAPVGLIGLVLMPFLGRNLDRLNLRAVSSFAFVMFGITMYWMSTLNHEVDFWQLIAPRFWQGLGMACFFVPLNQILLSEIGPEEIASASGLANFLRTLCASFSTAICVWLWTHRTGFHYAMLSEHVQGANWTGYGNALQAAGVGARDALSYTSTVVASQARTLAANDLYRSIAYMFWLLTPVVWLARPPFRLMGGGGAH